MAKTPPEKLAAALRANLKRRKQASASQVLAEPAKDHEKYKEKPAGMHSPSAKESQLPISAFGLSRKNGPR